MRPYFIQAISNCAISASAIFIPIFAKELGASYLSIGLIGTSYGMAIFLSSYIFGRLSDMYGYKLFLKIGLLVAGFAFFFQSFASSPTTLLLIRFMAGFSAGIFPASLATYVYESKRKLGRFAAWVLLDGQSVVSQLD